MISSEVDALLLNPEYLRMYKLKCKCLNITIHVQKGGERKAEGKELVSESCTASFFSGNILEIKLAVGGIKKEVDTLVRRSTAEDWDIYRCINCETDVYAIHAVKGFDRVLVSPQLESDMEVIKKMEYSPDFSPAFRILLKKNSKEAENEEDKPVLLGQDQLTHSMNLIQESIKKYLKAEETAVNERIKQYTAEQKELFSSLKSRAYQDKSAIFSVLSDTEERLMQSSIHEAMTETLESDSLPSIDQKYPHGLEFKKPTPHPVKRSHVKRDYKSKPSKTFMVGSPGNQSSIMQRYRPPMHKVHVKTEPTASDADPMFPLDGFTDDCEPFFESEEEDVSSDNSFQSEAETTILRNLAVIKKPYVYSTSVPISLPTGMKTAHSWEDDDDNDNTAVPELSKIGESMRALARSVQGNTEDMFGELPRPRLFTEPRINYR